MDTPKVGSPKGRSRSPSRGSSPSEVEASRLRTLGASRGGNARGPPKSPVIGKGKGYEKSTNAPDRELENEVRSLMLQRESLIEQRDQFERYAETEKTSAHTHGRGVVEATLEIQQIKIQA